MDDTFCFPNMNSPEMTKTLEYITIDSVCKNRCWFQAPVTKNKRISLLLLSWVLTCVLMYYSVYCVWFILYWLFRILWNCFKYRVKPFVLLLIFTCFFFFCLSRKVDSFFISSFISSFHSFPFTSSHHWFPSSSSFHSLFAE